MTTRGQHREQQQKENLSYQYVFGSFWMKAVFHLVSGDSEPSDDMPWYGEGVKRASGRNSLS